jgi:alpha-glucosidase
MKIEVSMEKDFLWWRDGIIYQIYPRSFADSNNDGIGDLIGIISKLDYLADLGIDAIWLSPIYPSPDVDFGYDVSDYLDIDPRFGTLDDLDRLISEAHQRDIRIVLDLVLNHTSDQHPWFVESRKSKDNPYRDWYIWQEVERNSLKPNNWQSVFGGSGWEYDPQTEQYYFHMFYKEQPDVNWRNPEARAALLDVFRYWLDRGVDGFRLDVFNVYFKDAQFRSNPLKMGRRPFEMQQHIHDVNQPEMIPLLKDVRSILDRYPESYAVGETFEEGGKTASHYVGDDLLHATFDFTLIESKWRAENFLNFVQNWDNTLSENKVQPTYVLNNHDNPRSSTRFGKGEDDERLKVAAAFLLTQRGTPYLYYGEEIGMRDIPIRSKKDIKDPIGKRYWPFFVGRDGCRAPMQWNSQTNAGFSDVDPWLPVHQNYIQRNVEDQVKDPDSLLNFYKKLIAVRKAYSALRTGMFTPVTYNPVSILAYLRQQNEQTILIALNFSYRNAPLIFGAELSKQSWKVLVSNKHLEDEIISGRQLELKGNEACILLKTEK